jgi:hypothetical protein
MSILSLRTPRRRENWAGLPVDAAPSWVCEPVHVDVWGPQAGLTRWSAGTVALLGAGDLEGSVGWAPQRRRTGATASVPRTRNGGLDVDR